MKPTRIKVLKETELVGPLTKSEHVRYKALLKELDDVLDIMSVAFVRLGSIMRDIRDERLYREEFSSFEDFCRAKVGTGKRYINRVIMAQGVIEILLEANVEKTALPSSERLCRELAQYPAADMKKIWTTARQLALAHGKAQPDGMTVREAAVQIEGSPRAKERQAKELIQKMEGIVRALKVSIAWDELSLRETKRLKKALSQIVGMAASILKAAPLEDPEPSEVDDPVEDTDDVEQSSDEEHE